MDFWLQVLIQFLGGLLVVIVVALAGRAGAHFIRQRRRETAPPAEVRPL
ncbi:MAG: hypothetical protein H5T64_10675, partial [Chloroflexi bacterium]|nr:hypothetical protein [Chloroflexota bacterium]